MRYYSTNLKSPEVGLKEAVLKGLAPDNGLYMPDYISGLSTEFFRKLPELSLPEIGFEVTKLLFEDEIDLKTLKEINEDALSFEIPLVSLSENIKTLELFHGPTCAFKDVGGRFIARLMAHLTRGEDNEINVLTATSGDTGSAVASGFYNVEGINVFILFPKGKVSHIQEQQLTTYGGNITAIEIDGTFDDCQKLVKTAFLDKELNEKLTLTSANSINLARFLPQSFYYFSGYGQLGQNPGEVVMAVPSGNFGNLTAGLIAKKMGLPIKRFIAATNVNDVVPEYLNDGEFNPRPSIKTIANAMDVGNPSNFARMLDLFENSHEKMSAEIQGYRLNDEGIRSYMKEIYEQYHYVADPHGAVGYGALKELLKENETGIFFETAHPAKFKDVVDDTLKIDSEIPERLKVFLNKEKKAHNLGIDFNEFKSFLIG
ncbi:threonine synthase [Flexithrix dorotheae]|uniref:threonine synthase n=1 Tax=Flexithrix dorotheae TaxID=70993 RepID=UPI00036C3AB2|nr:threonine synthase [Flexithrix dorotheae]